MYLFSYSKIIAIGMIVTTFVPCHVSGVPWFFRNLLPGINFNLDLDSKENPLIEISKNKTVHIYVKYICPLCEHTGSDKHAKKDTPEIRNIEIDFDAPPPTASTSFGMFPNRFVPRRPVISRPVEQQQNI